MYLTLPDSYYKKEKKIIVSTVTTKSGHKVKVDSLIQIKSFIPISSLKEYAFKTKDKRQLEYEHYDLFTDSIRVFHWYYCRQEKTEILKEFCFFKDFQILDYCYFKVKDEIYYYKSKIEGADTATFRTFLRMQNKSEWPATLARDKNHIYGGSLVLEKKRAHEKYFFYADSLQHLLK
nr:DKNYY domain-containing protein [Ancylomarina sp. 16SWW S1-10-2]